MRGRKADSVFIGNFIVECANKGKATPEDIIKEAKNQINIIDEKIKEVERIRLTRSKYLDVIDALEKSEKSDKVDEIKVLNFFKLQHPDICRKPYSGRHRSLRGRGVVDHRNSLGQSRP